MKADPFRRFAKRVLPKRARTWLLSRRWLLYLIRKRRSLIAPKRLFFAHSPDDSLQSPFPFLVSKNNVLEELGTKYMPSKRTHNYLAYYWMHFRDIRLDVRSVLEIGVQTDRSICMWEEFFPNATIYGVDIDPTCKKFEGDRRRILIGDQGDPEFLRQVMQEPRWAFDVIIDDGSHRVDHQLKTFEMLLPAMSDHGIYVIEDTGGCVADYELTTINALMPLIDSVMYWPRGFDPRNWPHLTEFPADAKWSDKNIVGIAFYRWIVFVMRGKNPQDNPFLTPLPPQ